MGRAWREQGGEDLKRMRILPLVFVETCKRILPLVFVETCKRVDLVWRKEDAK
jgi:hypothetical protein|tara:strand:- start:173 stop:331 length:159 start_codon:yes stop_codon:yes gene_type:complete